MIFALERLRALREGRSLDDLDMAGPESLPMEWRIEFEERAAILEYDGGLSREKAEILALREIFARIKAMVGDGNER
jgi:hypothetical protein